jgi:hypothetical protein
MLDLTKEDRRVGKSIRWILIAIVLAVIANVVREASKAGNEVDARIALRGACARQAQAGNTIPADKIEPMCNCAVDRTAVTLGPTRFIRLAEVTQATHDDKSVLLESFAACIREQVAAG